MLKLASYALSIFAFVRIQAAPSSIMRRGVVPISTTKFEPFTQFALAAYCPVSKLKDWDCGNACSAVGDFHPSLVGGDGIGVQNYFVGYWPAQHTIIVGHEGTDPTKLIPLLTDINIIQVNADPRLFVGIPIDVLVHDGFLTEHTLTAAKILNEVKVLMTAYKTKSVTTVGHSLGGALAELDALYLTLNLPSDTGVRGVTYGTPRVGNPAFVQFFDSKVANFNRINNIKDPIPTVPPRELGFLHPHGEIHIISVGHAVLCPGDDDRTDDECQAKTVPSLLVGNLKDHLGPYDGISIGTEFCI